MESPGKLRGPLRLVLRCVVLLLVVATPARGFALEGSQTSYAAFPAWQPCTNGSLVLEFQTRQPNGLLLYLDDGGVTDFLEVKLVGGVARLRYNLGGGPVLLSAGHHLHDGKWHKVVVSREDADTSFMVDSTVQRSTAPGFDFTFGNTSSRALSPVYVGGLPLAYSARLSHLALPSVMFEPRFRGNVRNVMFAQCGDVRRRADMQEHSGVRRNNADACQERNRCQNAGVCISTDTGSFCDCRHTDFTGQYCEIGKPLPQIDIITILFTIISKYPIVLWI